MSQRQRPAGERLLTLARDLKRRKARERRALFVAEGTRAVEELQRSTIAIEGVLVTRALRGSPRGAALVASLERRSTECAEVTEKDLASAADTDNTQGILAIAKVPDTSLDTLPAGSIRRMLVLDAIQDPGNVGTLVRTAAALGAGAVVALPGTADLWGAKTIRAGAGAHFRIPSVSSTIDDLVPFLRERDVTLWGTAADGVPLGSVQTPDRLALAVGNEGAGLTPRVRAASYLMVALPMEAGIESLNVAVAAAIALYALRPSLLP